MNIMHKPSYSEFGRIDFLSIMQFFVTCLGASLQTEWTLFAPELVMVGQKAFMFTIESKLLSYIFYLSFRQ